MQPENVLLQKTGHIKLTDFDLSYMGGTVDPKVTFNPSVIKRKVKVRLRGPPLQMSAHPVHTQGWQHQQAAHALQETPQMCRAVGRFDNQGPRLPCSQHAPESRLPCTCVP